MPVAKVAMQIQVGSTTRAIAVGDPVNFDDRIGGQRIGDLVNLDHFTADAPAPAVPSASAPAPAKQKTKQPAEPADSQE